MSKDIPQNVNESTPDRDLVLHHIDKVYSTLSRTWDTAKRIVITELVLSLAIIALASRLILVEDNLEVSGLKFKLSLTALLSIGALLVAALLSALGSQINHGAHLATEIRRLYASIGYKPSSLYDEKTDPFEDPGFYYTLVLVDSGKSRNKLIALYHWLTSAVIVIGVVIILPLAAQVAAGLKVASLFGWRWWILTVFGVLIAFTAWSVVALFSD